MSRLSNLMATLRRWARAAADVWYGMTAYGFWISLRRERTYVERMFMLLLVGDLLGLPILSPYYSLRLLPYILPSIHRWQVEMLRERDIVDLLGEGDSLG